MSEPIDATIVKIEEDKQLVFGWANIIKTAEGKMLLDRQDDFIDDESELEKAAYHYVLHSRDGGEMHLRKGVSTLVESVVLTDEKQRALGIPANTVPTGWWIGFKVNDDSVWKQIKKGGYVGFSVHGTGRRERTPLDLHKYTDIEKDAPVRQGISKYIKQKPNGKWCVYSEAGKVLGEYNSKGEAKKRLAQIEHFKKEQPTSSDVHVDSVDWDRRRRKRRILTNAALEKFNQNHDDRGRFTTAEGNTTGVGGGAAPKGGGRRYASQGSRRIALSAKEAKEYDSLSARDKQAYRSGRFGRYKDQRASHAQGMRVVRRWRKSDAEDAAREAKNKKVSEGGFKSGSVRRAGEGKHIMQVSSYAKNPTYKYHGAEVRGEVTLTDKELKQYRSLKKPRARGAYQSQRLYDSGDLGSHKRAMETARRTEKRDLRRRPPGRSKRPSRSGGKGKPSKAATRGLKGLTKKQKSLHPRAQVKSLQRSAKTLMGKAERAVKYSGDKAKAAEYGKKIADKMAAAEYLNRTHKLGYNVNLKQVERAALDLGIDISE